MDTPVPWPLAWPQPSDPLEQEAALLRVDGPDSLRFLHGQSSQDLQLAQPGQWRRSCCLSPTARVTALVEVLADANGAWLVITAGEGAAVRAQLDRVLFPADAVTLGSPEPVRLIERPLAALQANGPDAPADGRWCPLDGDPAKGFQLGRGWTVERGTATQPCDAGAGNAGTGDAAAALRAEQWRIQRGRPNAPGELNGETNPFELGLAQRVSLNKGCYVGQETLARLVTYDGIKQQLRRWHWRGTAAQAEALATTLQAGQALMTPDGERAGRLTSLLRLEDPSETGLAAPHGDGSVLLIGLALVRRQALEEPWLTPAWEHERAGEPPRLLLSRPEEFSLPGD